ncbi:MAG: YkgJ family cysteine cluster protein [Candidatus Nanoarchaeia archaeon]
MTTLNTTPPVLPPPTSSFNPIDENTSAIAREIAQEARDSLSSFCMNVCGAKCCKVGKLLLQSDEEVETISGAENIGQYLEDGTLERTQNGFMTYDLEKQPCQHLKESVLCSIHKSEKKPTICNDYPLFLTKQYVIASEQCLGVVSGELDTFIAKIKALGYKKF